MMGAGKSTVAPLVAERLGRSWHDTDRMVEQRSGETVEALFERGEEAFRQEEAAAVRSVAGAPVVVACGGGVVLDDALVAEMRGGGVILWLRVPLDVLAARSVPARPLLGEGPEALGRILREREDRYRAAADAVVDGAGPSAEVADRVVEAWSISS
jgi:shikimate kinase